MKQVLTYTLIWLFCLNAPILAQEEEDAGGYLVGFLEDNLSGENRYINVTGLDGAFSSQATIKQLTISDDDGVWVTINNAVLDWNRLALIRGRFSVNTLSADEIILARPPKPVETETPLPSPEAHPFALPDLPVAIELGKISVKRFKLGKPVMGIVAELEVSGALTLADGALDTNLNIKRLDRATDTVALVAKFENETSLITLDLTVNEDENGLIASALHIPDAPPLMLTAKGKGPVNDFTADINLSTNGQSRVAGQVRLQEVPAPDGSADSAPGISFDAKIGGDVTPLLAAEYQPFFGAKTQLDIVGQRGSDGRIELSRFDISSEALALNGALIVAANGVVEKLNLDGRISSVDGTDVVLPMTGARTVISAADISARLDETNKNKWDLKLSIDGLSRPDLSLSQAQITASGTLQQGDISRVEGQFKAAIDGMEFADSATDQAVGRNVSLTGDFAVSGDKALELSHVSMQGQDYTASLDGVVSGLESGFSVDGTVRVGAADLSRFSGLAGQTLGGAINATIQGNGSPLGGQFDFRFDARGQDLSSGIEQLDALIGGQTILSMDAERGSAGLKINSFQLDGQALNANAQGTVSSTGSDLTFEATLDDIARVIPEVSGPLKLHGDVLQDTKGKLSGKVRMDGPKSSFIDLAGTLVPNGAATLTYTAELDRIERFFPEMSGSIESKGSAQRKGTVWTIDGQTKAKAEFTAQIGGTWDEKSGLSHLSANGAIQMAIANRILKPNSIVGLAKFDLTLDGKADLAGLKGTVTTKDAKFVLPSFAQSINNINTKIELSDGKASLSATAALAAGGTIRAKGPISLKPPFKANITTDLQQIILTDNISFQSTANGQLVFSGPLTGNANLSGQITFGETDINLNTASGSVGAAPIPVITHLHENRAERDTRDRAGLIVDSNAPSGPVIGLDITLTAPDRVFARGRGVQAELGGQIHVRGSTADLQPAGQIELIRGTINLLGRKLKLSRGIVTLQSKLGPYVEFAASNSTSEGTATIEIAGPLSTPKVNVYSDPERPSEEALAMLIFGNRFAEMSPLAIAQMAASLSTLSGGGDEGLGKDNNGSGEGEKPSGLAGAGKYALDNVYTDFTTNTRGDTELNLNLDVSDKVTLKGTVDNKGATSVGIFFERDY